MGGAITSHRSSLHSQARTTKPSDGYGGPPQLFQPMQISDPSMKKLNLYKVIPYKHEGINSYARRQNSVLTRDIAAERASKINLDILP